MTSLSNRVVSIYDRKTSMRLAPAEWQALETICKREKIKRKKLLELIDTNRDLRLGLTSSVRLFSIIYYCNSVANKKKDNNQDAFYNPIFDAINGII